MTLRKSGGFFCVHPKKMRVHGFFFFKSDYCFNFEAESKIRKTMQTLLFIIGFLLSSLAFGQMEITLYGDPNSESIRKQKERFEQKGFTVNIEEEKSREEKKSEHPFIRRWTGQQLPDWELTTLDGKKISTSMLRGKNVHINLWSTTCKPCIEEFAELNELKEKYEDQWVFLALAPESEKKVEKVIKKHPLDYQTVADAAAIFREMEVEGYPKNLFVDSKGKIIKVTDGTQYKLGEENGELVMIPDNFRIYDEIMKNFNLNQ